MKTLYFKFSWNTIYSLNLQTQFSYFSFHENCFIFPLLFHLLPVYYGDTNHPYMTWSCLPYILASDCFNILTISFVFTEIIKPFLFYNFISFLILFISPVIDVVLCLKVFLSFCNLPLFISFCFLLSSCFIY